MSGFVNYAQEPNSLELRVVPVPGIGEGLEHYPRIGRNLAIGVAR